MDGQTLFTLVANTGFAIAVAAYLVKWVTQQLNGKLDRLIEVQEELVELQRKLNEFQREILVMMRRWENER